MIGMGTGRKSIAARVASCVGPRCKLKKRTQSRPRDGAQMGLKRPEKVRKGSDVDQWTRSYGEVLDAALEGTTERVWRGSTMQTPEKVNTSRR